MPQLASRARLFALTAATSLGAAVLVTSPAVAKPQVCTTSVVQQALISAGKLTQDDVDGGEGVDLIRCGDVTDDGASDAVFTVASGGTAGDIRFGVLEGATDGSAGKLVLYHSGYKVGVARVNSKAFDILQPNYGPNDPNCCPSSFSEVRYTWNGTRFKAGKRRKLKSAPRRFYR